MNKRSFLSTIIKAAVAPMILPAAVTYGRRWVKQGELYLVKEYEVVFLMGNNAYKSILVGPPPSTFDLARKQITIPFTDLTTKSIVNVYLRNRNNPMVI
jgi:hypothetical protein